jgi:hypothetical protein
MLIDSSGIPHLAKNERDVGHPTLMVGTESGASSHADSKPDYIAAEGI